MLKKEPWWISQCNHEGNNIYFGFSEDQIEDVHHRIGSKDQEDNYTAITPHGTQQHKHNGGLWNELAASGFPPNKALLWKPLLESGLTTTNNLRQTTRPVKALGLLLGKKILGMAFLHKGDAWTFPFSILLVAPNFLERRRTLSAPPGLENGVAHQNRCKPKYYLMRYTLRHIFHKQYTTNSSVCTVNRIQFLRGLRKSRINPENSAQI